MNYFTSLNALANNYENNQSNPYSLIIMLIIFGIVFYIMILYPQQKRTKIHKKLIESIAKGDEIMTTGGIVGYVVKKLSNGYVLISINENNTILIKQDFINIILPKGTIKKL